MNCSGGSRNCVYGGPVIPRDIRKKQEFEEIKNKPPRELKRKEPDHDNGYLQMFACFTAGGPSSVPEFPDLQFDPRLVGTIDPTMLMAPSPLPDMALSSDQLLARLPSLVPLTRAEREGLDYYLNEASFGFGSKAPGWSTHAIILKAANDTPAVLHLLFAAAQAEKGSRCRPQQALLDSADNNFRLGWECLKRDIAEGQMDPTRVMGSFWFLYIHQRHRRPTGHRISYQELSHRVAEYIRAHQIYQILATPNSDDAAWPAKTKALVARLMIWLFWADTQAAFLGEGGFVAKLLLGSGAPRALLDLYKVSKEALSLNWDLYPYDEQVDDLQNASALEFNHRGWIIVAEINEALDATGHLDAETSAAIKAKIEALRQRAAVKVVLRLIESVCIVKDRLMLNSTWAAANYDALCVYHFRASLVAEDEPFSSVSPDSTHIAGVVSTLLMLVQESLAGEDKGQASRLQWSLFWAGLETTDGFKQGCILMWLKNEGLKQALRSVFMLQAVAGLRASLATIREICKASCGAIPDSSPGAWEL